MLRKDVGNFPRLLAVAYAVAQILGAIAGALVSWFLLGNFIGMKQDPYISLANVTPIGYNKNSDSGNIYPNCDYKFVKEIPTDVATLMKYEYSCSTAGYVFAAMVAEVVGSFFFSFFFLT